MEIFLFTTASKTALGPTHLHLVPRMRGTMPSLSQYAFLLKLGDDPLSAVRGCLFSTFAAAIHNIRWRLPILNLRTRGIFMTWDPLCTGRCSILRTIDVFSVVSDTTSHYALISYNAPLELGTDRLQVETTRPAALQVH